MVEGITHVLLSGYGTPEISNRIGPKVMFVQIPGTILVGNERGRQEDNERSPLGALHSNTKTVGAEKLILYMLETNFLGVFSYDCRAV